MCFHKAETSSRSSRPSGRRGKAEPPKCLMGGWWSESGGIIAARPPTQPSVRLGAEVYLFINFFQDERFVSPKTCTRGHVGRAVASPSQQRTCLPCVAGAAKRASTYPSPRVSQGRGTFFHLVVQRQSLTCHVATLHLALLAQEGLLKSHGKWVILWETCVSFEGGTSIQAGLQLFAASAGKVWKSPWGPKKVFQSNHTFIGLL